MSPTQRTLAELRRLGYLAAVVEHWNPHARIRQDLFGCIDVLAIGPRVELADPYVLVPVRHDGPLTITLAVQATSGSNVAARIEKLTASPALPRLIAAGWRVEVWGWRKMARSRRWELRRERVGCHVT